VRIAYPFLEDLVITLTSPDGTVATLVDRVECCGDIDLVAANPITFDDASANDPEFMASPNMCTTKSVLCYAGNIIPAQTVFSAGLTTAAPNDSLTDMFGDTANGNWILNVADTVVADDGILQSWSLESYGCPSAAPSPPPTPPPTPAPVTAAPVPPTPAPTADGGIILDFGFLATLGSFFVGIVVFFLGLLGFGGGGGSKSAQSVRVRKALVKEENPKMI